MSAKYLISLNNDSQLLEALPSEMVFSVNAAAYAKREKAKYMVLAQADNKQQAMRFISLLHGTRAA